MSAPRVYPPSAPTAPRATRSHQDRRRDAPAGTLETRVARTRTRHSGKSTRLHSSVRSLATAPSARIHHPETAVLQWSLCRFGTGGRLERSPPRWRRCAVGSRPARLAANQVHMFPDVQVPVRDRGLARLVQQIDDIGLVLRRRALGKTKVTIPAHHRIMRYVIYLVPRQSREA